MQSLCKIISNLSVKCNRTTCLVNKRSLQTSASNNFYEKYEKGDKKYTKSLPPLKERLRIGLKEIKHEIALWKQEMKETIEADPLLINRPGETDIVWKFGDEQSLDKWVVTSDSDHSEGYSSCSLTLTENKKGLFTGELSKKVPKDGRVKRSGYCNITTLRARKSFKRDSYLNWQDYNMLVIKVRGDGRSYLLNLAVKGSFDLMWQDIYHYVLFTRGGPYWQISRIPLSKFFFSSKGRIQDRQEQIPLDRITSFGITAADKVDGSFSLEIDYVGVEYDPNFKEEFAYEMYKTADYISAT